MILLIHIKMGGMIMTDFNILRKRYSDVLCGRGYNGKKTADCILQSDERTEQRLVQLGGRIEKAITSNEPGVINATLKGILDISISFSQNNSQFYHNKNIKNEIFNALNTLEKVYNDTTVPKGNWWYWEIGIPLSINSIFTLMYDYTDKSQLKRYMAAEKHFNYRIKLTGANRLWESVIFAVRGILLSDNDSIKNAISGIQDVMVITDSGDGFYKDGSFIQHDNIPYNCGYGRSLIQELAPMLYIFKDTEFENKNTDIINTWIEKSYLPFIYNGRTMDMVRGREISRYYEQSDLACTHILSAMLILSEMPEFNELKGTIKTQITDNFFEYASVFTAELAEHLQEDNNIKPKEIKPYFMAFNSMDRVVKHGNGYTIGLAMHSERTAAYESINDENQNAHHTSDGMMYIYKKNEPKSDFFWPTIDLQRLPGTTVLRGSTVKPNINAAGDFTGGCGIGENGVCTMKLISNENSLKANKSWFFFDKEVVCLGSCINSEEESEVETIIENRLVTDNSRFTVHGNEESEGYIIKGAYLDGSHDVGYCFPEEQEVNIFREIRSGDWNNMSIKSDGKSYKGRYLTMWIKHGRKVKDVSYEYIVIPKCHEEEINDYYRKSGIRIIENSDSIQCVKKNGTTGVVFLKDKTHSAGGISCDRRCIVMTTQTCGTLELSISDITQKQDKIYIELDYSAQEIISKSERINIIQLVPYVCMEIDTCAARGEEQHIKFGGVKNV